MEVYLVRKPPQASRSVRGVAAALLCGVCIAVLLVFVGTDSGKNSGSNNSLEFKMPSPYPDEVWVYEGATAAGRRDDVEGGGVAALDQLIRRDHYETKIHVIGGMDAADLRQAYWNPNCKVVVFPPLSEYPVLSKAAAEDTRQWVAAGGNLVFVGSYMLEMFLNDIFHWEIDGTYGRGPYYLNPRAAMNSPFAYLSAELPEIAASNVVAVTSRSLPEPGGHCVYDSKGVCVSFYVSYRLGTVSYIADGYSMLSDFKSPEANKWVKLLHAAIMV